MSPHGMGWCGCRSWRGPLSSHLWAVLYSALEDLCNRLGGAMLALQLRERLVQRLLAREHADCVLQDGPCCLHAASVQGFLETPHRPQRFT